MNKWLCRTLAVAFAVTPLSAFADQQLDFRQKVTHKVVRAEVAATKVTQAKKAVKSLSTEEWKSLKKEAQNVTDKTSRLEVNEIKFHNEVAKYASKHINAIDKLNKEKETDKTAALKEYGKNLDKLYKEEINKVHEALEAIEIQKDPTSVKYELYFNLLKEDAQNDMQLWDRAQGSMEDPFEEYCNLRKAYEEDPNNSLIQLINSYKTELNIEEK